MIIQTDNNAMHGPVTRSQDQEFVCGIFDALEIYVSIRTVVDVLTGRVEARKKFEGFVNGL